VPAASAPTSPELDPGVDQTQGPTDRLEERHGMNTVLLRLDLIGQAAAVKLDATDLEAI
jgi:hypothetical protein